MIGSIHNEFGTLEVYPCSESYYSVNLKYDTENQALVMIFVVKHMVNGCYNWMFVYLAVTHAQGVYWCIRFVIIT